MSKIILTLFIALNAMAAPTKRPLPDGFVDNNQYFSVMRDHEEERKFFMVPKQMEVYENVLQTFGEQKEGCVAVAKYNQAQKTLIETKQQHAEISLKRALLINKLLSQVLELEDKIIDLTLEKMQLQNKLANETLTEEERAAIEKRIAEIDNTLTFFQNRVTQIKELQAIAESEQNQLLAQLEKLEQSLAEFEKQVVRPSAKISVRMRLVHEDLLEASFREKFGFRKSDTVLFPKLVGLSLYPTDFEHLGFLEKSKLTSEIGLFTPQWSIKALDLQSTYFGKSTLSDLIETREMPKTLFFEQILSLFGYCAVKQLGDGSNGFYVPLRIGYQLAHWVDQQVAGTEKQRLFTYRLGLNAQKWKVIESLPVISGENLPTIDPGHPNLYGNGIYEPKPIDLKFHFKKEGE